MEKKVRFENASKLTLVNTELRSNLLYFADPVNEGSARFLDTTRMSRVNGIEVELESEVNEGTIDDVNIIMIVNGALLFFDDTFGDWIVSDGSYAQSNPITSLEKEQWLLLLQDESMVSFMLVFKNENPFWITSVTYDFWAEEDTPATIPKCLVYGYITGEDGKPKEGYAVKIRLNYDKKQLVAAGNTLIFDTIVLTTDSNGYWSTPLIPSDQYDQANPMQYILEYGINRNVRRRKLVDKIYFEVPNTDEANIKTIIV